MLRCKTVVLIRKLLLGAMLFLLGYLVSSIVSDYILRDFIIALISFSVGVLTALVIKDALGTEVAKQNVGLAVSVLITLVWTASVIAEIMIATFTVSPLVHGLMGVIAAFFFKDGHKLKDIQEKLK